VNGHQRILALRRQELVARSASQRSALIAGVEPFLGKAAALDRIVSGVRRYSVVVGIVAGAVTLFGSGKLLQVATRVLTVLTLLRRG